MNRRYRSRFFFNDKKLLSHMTQISEHINSSNHNIHSYDQTRKMIFNIGSEKGKNNDNPSPQLTHQQTMLITFIVNNPENYLSNDDQKY